VKPHTTDRPIATFGDLLGLCSIMSRVYCGPYPEEAEALAPEPDSLGDMERQVLARMLGRLWEGMDGELRQDVRTEFMAIMGDDYEATFDFGIADVMERLKRDEEGG
jgi:hypothetical protein